MFVTKRVAQPPKATTLKKAKFKFEEKPVHDKKNLPTTHWVSNIAFSCDKHSPYPRGSWPNRDRTLSLWIVGNTSTLHRVLSLHVTTGRSWFRPNWLPTRGARVLRQAQRRISSPERLFPSVLLKALDTHREPDHPLRLWPSRMDGFSPEEHSEVPRYPLRSLFYKLTSQSRSQVDIRFHLKII